MRLGVALLVPAPFDREVDAFRRALGDRSYGRIPAHLTLVPPVNVAAGRLGDALAVLRAAAAVTRPFTVELGAPATFLPDTPVLYLPVTAGADQIHALRERIFVDPLARELTWPFVPHVTVAEEASPERVDAARTAMADYAATMTFNRVHLLRQQDDRMWRVVAEAQFAPARIIGRGGLELELATTTTADPQAQTLLADLSRQAAVVTARREGVVAGVAALALGPGEAALGTAEHLHAALQSAALEILED